MCVFPSCSRLAAVTLRMVVEGHDSVLPACAPHARQVGAYAAEEALVRIVDTFGEGLTGVS